ncbi:MAG: formamidopyrimidine-DNA glycosylase, partial [Ilumatobacteraceae bacterium]|nr:formamidopyrimidine-DNA glycosylase [Ilumatobacteraceae bacterium]
MPELPDVGSARRLVDRHVPGLVITDVEVNDAGVVRNTSAAGLRRSLRHRTMGHPDRRGKWLMIPTDGPILMVHFGMTGSLRWSAELEPAEPDDRVVIEIALGELRYRDLRKLQGIWLAEDDDDVRRIIGPQGPDALGLPARHFAAAIQGRRGSIKAALMDQAVIAGLGNMLSDEL